MNVLSVCDGIGAAHVAWHGLGWRPYVLSEIEAFPRAVLQHRHGARDARQPASRCAPLLWGDFTTLRERFLKRFGRSFAEVDVLAGGTPCQAFSIAGNRLSLADTRGNLTLAFVGLANAIDARRRHAQRSPSWIVWENVPGVFSTKDNAFGAFLGALCGSGTAIDPPRDGKWTDAGVVSGPTRCAAWRLLDAQHFGLAQRRRRVIVVARGYFGGAGEWDGPDALLPIIESVRWHPSPRRKAGQAVAGALDASLGGGDDNDAQSGRLAMCLNAGGMKRQDAESETLIVHTLRAQGFDASEDGTGRGAPIVPMTPAPAFHARQDPDSGQVTHPLDTDGGSIGILCEGVALRGREGGATAELTGDIIPALRTGGGGGDKPHALSMMTVRRLTPRECERLQGFPEDYTLIPFRNGMAADGPRYKALGNSWAVPKMRYVGERIAAINAREVSP